MNVEILKSKIHKNKYDNDKRLTLESEELIENAIEEIALEAG